MSNIWNKPYQLFRYIVSGYIFKRKKIYEKLQEFEGEDWSISFSNPLKVVLYTVVIGNYDSILPAPQLDGVDCYLITDQKNVEGLGWKVIDINNANIPDDCTQVELSRYFKFHPEKVFEQYDYSIYIDGNIKVCADVRPIFNKMEETGKIICIHKHSTRDCIYEEGKIIYALGRAKYRNISKQLRRYRAEGMPKHYGLFENNIIARKHNDPRCMEIMDLWWKEYHSECKRDQLSLVYSLWKLGYDSNFVLSMGSNSRNNPMFEVVSHN